MPKDGYQWRRGDLGSMSLRFGAMAQTIDDKLEAIVRAFLEEAVAEMRQSIRTRGVRGGVPNNEGRVVTGDMLDSVEFALDYNKGVNVLGEFGYLYNVPKYALFQEYGTRGGQGNGRGILEMLALTDAFRNFETKLADAVANGRLFDMT